MQNYGLPLTFNIPLDLPNIDIVFWMRQFTTDTMAKRYRINYPSASLYIQKSISYQDRMALDKTAQSALSFSIYEGNLEDAKEMCQEVLSWFHEENKKDLYGYSDSGILMFNTDYQKLNAMLVNEFSGVRTALKIVPTVIEIANQVYEPGVIFYINLEANGIPLREYQIKKLCKFIINFNFIPYCQFAMQCFQYTASTGALLSREQVQQRLDAQRQYNTNFNY